MYFCVFPITDSGEGRRSSIPLATKRQGNWRVNCKPGGLCGMPDRTLGANYWWAMCYTRNSKKNDPDYCGQCKYGFRSASGPNDYCCTWKDVIQNAKGYCLCQAEDAPNCPVALSTPGEKLNFYSIKLILLKPQGWVIFFIKY